MQFTTECKDRLIENCAALTLLFFYYYLLAVVVVALVHVREPQKRTIELVCQRTLHIKQLLIKNMQKKLYA